MLLEIVKKSVPTPIEITGVEGTDAGFARAMGAGWRTEKSRKIKSRLIKVRGL
jgi:hypothetical protein